MRQTNSRQLFDYWNRIRGDRLAPRREEIEPSDIRHLLSDTFILEVSGTMRTVSYRLAGTRLCAVFGRELKGYGFLGHWSEEDCFEIAKLLTRVYRDFQPIMLIMRGETASGKTVDYEFVILPLEPMQDGSARILGVAVPSKDYYWLGAEPLVNCHLRSMRHLTDEVVASRKSAGQGKEDERPNAPSLAPSLSPAQRLPGEGVPRSFIDLQSSSSENGTRKVAHLVVHDGGRE